MESSTRDKNLMQEILAKEVEAYRRQIFLEGLSSDFAALRKNETEWKAEKIERFAWDVTLTDGAEP